MSAYALMVPGQNEAHHVQISTPSATQGIGYSQALHVPKLQKSEKKRDWRHSLSDDRLRKMRERDAERKRIERRQMTVEQRRVEREKDARRKALKRLREKERRRLASAMSLNRILNNGS